MKTTDNISIRRGKASFSGLNSIIQIFKWFAILLASILSLVLWVFIRPILRGFGWVASLISAFLLIYWLLTL